MQRNLPIKYSQKSSDQKISMILQRIVTDDPLLYKKNRMKESKYPPIQYVLTGDELDGLVQSGYLDDDGKLLESISCKNMSA